MRHSLVTVFLLCILVAVGIAAKAFGATGVAVFAAFAGVAVVMRLRAARRRRAARLRPGLGFVRLRQRP